MNAQTEALQLQGAAGAIEALRDQPEGTPRGVAVISHPHPLFGGSMTNKVVQTLARAFVQDGWIAVRYNFRGVGASAGTHDEGRGEADDLMQVIDQVAPQGALALAGFSFGAFVTSHGAARLQQQGRHLDQLVLVGTAASRFTVAPVAAELQPRTLVVHGETDDVVPLASVLDWARPQSLPVTVVPGVGHFFHGQLPLLKNIVLHHLHAAP
ncbi:MAG: thioesterase domain-containing protein [Brachymonas denitrificans]|jgi:alpha/beta superfamily hydrolase|uniref:alpha/beta hydrolase n=1 Tax=Brachymonas denitrificans TaxID=28220 RepID=UPI001BCC47AC|nr:thioesterase domain-containing protein [Brachymonas denitrificans]